MDEYVVSSLLKILVSTLILTYDVQSTPTPILMGGHLVNSNHTIKTTEGNSYDLYSEYEDSREISDSKNKTQAKETNSEEIPDPSPLVVPGYNLPETIFNSGRPFYVGKDPFTGKIDFSHKSPEVRSDDRLYDYVDEQPSDDIYDKANINRKDGSVSSSSHKHTDINQLTPNFHDFLNLPVKYNPEKYVYPLISSSYASTKIQGSVNKFHNHKDYNSYKTTTKKPTVSPTYYTTHSSYFNPRTTQRTFSTTTVTTTTTTQKPVTKRYPEIYLTTPLTNVLNTGMSHPSFGEEYDYYDSQTEIPTTTTTRKQVYSTTKKANIGDIYLTTDRATTIKPEIMSISTTTKRTLSLFEQLFGDYDETVTATEKTKLPTLFANLPNKKVDNVETTRSTTTQKSFATDKTDSDKNILSGSGMSLDTSYEYNDDYSDKVDDNLAVEDKVSIHTEDNLSVEPLKPEINTVVSIKAQSQEEVQEVKTEKSSVNLMTTEDSYLVQKITTEGNRVKETTTTTTTTTTTRKPTVTPNNPAPVSTPKVTSLPLGENHINTPSINRDPIIVATQNLREKLNSEKVDQIDYEEELPVPQNKQPPQISQVTQRPVQSPPVQGNYQVNNKHAPSSSSIHIPPGQDTVSFVMGHHQSVEGGTGIGGQYVGTSLNESPYDNNPFKPLVEQEAPPKEPNSYSQNRPGQVLNNYSSNRPVNRPIAVPQNRPNFASPNRPPHFVSPGRPAAPPQYMDSSGSAATIQPLKQSEASLAIGVPLSGNKPIPGKVVDDSPIQSEGKFDFSKEGGSRVVFPQEKIGQYPHKNYQQSFNNREVLKLNSKPMYHQLPSDLTPPKENEVISQSQKYERPVRPPWDPRPGHFYAGKPEYARPPRPRPDVAYKRIDNLPNILPQFRPNIKQQYPPYHFERVNNRPQPLFERQSNRPIGFFEKMLPPPPPQPFRGNPNPNLRHSVPQIDERSPLKTNLQSLDENETPMAEDRIINIEQEKKGGGEDLKIQELSLYQTPPNIKIANRRIGEDISEIETLQMIQAKNEKENEIKAQEESERPVDKDDNKPIQITAVNSVKDVNEKTIYKVYPVNTPPLKLDAIDSEKREGVVVGTHAEMPLPPSKIDVNFPYGQKDRNDAPILKPHHKQQNPSKFDFPYPLERPTQPNNDLDDSQQSSGFSNLWVESIEPKIVNGNKVNYNQISATLKTYTEKPIAVAYTPTESNYDSYSLPGFGRPGVVESEIYRDRYLPDYKKISQRIDTEIAVRAPEREGFQTPFQPSLQLDSANQGWTAVREKNKTNPVIEKETTTMPLATTGEFDIENFKPQLEGGFKPMYTIPEERLSEPVTEILEPRSEYN